MNIQLDRGAGFISIFWETWQGSRQKRKEMPPKKPDPQLRFLGRCRRCSVLSHTWSAIGRTFKEDYNAMNAFCRCKRYSWHFYVKNGRFYN